MTENKETISKEELRKELQDILYSSCDFLTSKVNIKPSDNLGVIFGMDYKKRLHPFLSYWQDIEFEDYCNKDKSINTEKLERLLHRIVNNRVNEILDIIFKTE